MQWKWKREYCSKDRRGNFDSFWWWINWENWMSGKSRMVSRLFRLEHLGKWGDHNWVRKYWKRWAGLKLMDHGGGFALSFHYLWPLCSSSLIQQTDICTYSLQDLFYLDLEYFSAQKPSLPSAYILVKGNSNK